MSFHGVRALSNVNFEARPGEILALMGENGAGKSTLMKILSGVIPFPSYEGSVLVNGRKREFKSTREARASGVAIIHQELNLFGELSVAENLFLTMEPLSFGPLGVIDESKRHQLAKQWLQEIGLSLDVDQPIKQLSVGNQQLVEILRSLITEARILIFDEPTSSLSHHESELLFHILNMLRSQGHTLIYISHRMDEVFRLADSIVVLRDGKSVGGGAKDSLTPESLISLMVGRPIVDLYPIKDCAIGKEVLKVEHFSVRPESPNDPFVRDVNFVAYEGEILGIAGLVGSGRTELVSALFGAINPTRVSGKVLINNVPVVISCPEDAIEAGMAFVTEDRKHNGLISGRSVEENITLAALHMMCRFGVIDENKSQGISHDYIDKLHIKTPSLEADIQTLSGGNQQKIVLSKWLALGPKVLILDEPTRGIDVGARQEIYALIHKLAKMGMTLLMVSSDLSEVIGMSDRVLVMKDGLQAALLTREEATQERVMSFAAGVEQAAPLRNIEK